MERTKTEQVTTASPGVSLPVRPRDPDTPVASVEIPRGPNSNQAPEKFPQYEPPPRLSDEP